MRKRVKEKGLRKMINQLKYHINEKLVIILLFNLLAPSTSSYPPTDDSWSRVPNNPVLRPALTWEGPCVCENVALWDESNHEFVIFYRGGWATQAVGRATSPDGLNWTKSLLPVYGWPSDVNGGEPWVYREGNDLSGTLLLYTTNNHPPHVFITSSNDGGLSWTPLNSSIVPPPSGSLWGNRIVWKEGLQWLMLQEVMAGPWQIFLYNSSDGLSWNVQNKGAPLSSLQLHSGGMYGGPRFASIDGTLTPRWPNDNLYHLWMHATNSSGGLPTDIYHATSADLINWSVTPGPAVKHQGSGFEFDQCAGPVPLTVGNKAYLFYDGDNNNVGNCSIGLVTAAATT
jgi:hypothetical protein